MVTEGHRKISKKPISLLLVEGETDEIFYKQVKTKLLTDYRCSIVKNLGGNYNINARVIERIDNYLQQHQDEKIRVYCCLDRESRYGQVPEFDIKRIKKYIKDENIRSVLSIDLIRATQQIESWFFYDVERIYGFLRVPRAQRKPRAFNPPEKFCYMDLQRLFERYGETYNKGKKAANFINHLNIEKIVSNCKELREGVQLIQSHADDLTNHLFPTRKRMGN
jgi:hypothetical protein